MRWRPVAGHEASVVLGARSVKYVLGLLVGVVLLSGYLYPLFGQEPYTTARFSGFVIGSLTTLVPFVGVLIGYGAVASERESGALRLSLSLPRSRSDLVFGKFLGRTAVLAGAVVFALAGAGFLVVYPFGDLELLPYLGFAALTVAFAGIWTGLGLAVSLSVATERRALVLGFGLFFAFVIAWDVAVSALQFGLESAGVVEGALPDPLRFVVGLPPGELYERVVTGFVDPAGSVDGPWYLGKWVALGLFALWGIGPLGLAYRRFEGSDLA